MGKIFVRHRRHVSKGERRPRFAVVASEGVDLAFYKTKVRRAELEEIAAELDVEVVYLPRGEHHDSEEGRKGSGRRRKNKK